MHPDGPPVCRRPAGSLAKGSHESVTSTPMPSWLVGLSAAGGEFFLRLGAREKAAAPHVTDRLHDDGRIIKSVFQTKHEERAWPHAVRERTNVHAVTGLASEAVIRAVDSIDTRCTVRVLDSSWVGGYRPLRKLV